MNILGKDLVDSNLQFHIANIYQEIMGDKYGDEIKRRISNTTYIYYTTNEGIRDYYLFLKRCKSKQLSLKFLEEIGYDISEEQQRSLAIKYLPETKKIVGALLGDSFSRLGFDYDEENSVSGIKSFDNSRLDNPDYPREEIEEWMRISQIHLLNFLRKRSDLTDENFDNFCLTDEYEKWKEKIEKYLETYLRIRKEYTEYNNSLRELRHAIQEEETALRELKDYSFKERQEYIRKRPEFIENSEKLTSNEDIKKMLIAYMNKSVCVQEKFTGEGALMFFTIRDENDIPRLDYMLLHEMFHAIGTTNLAADNIEIPEDAIELDEDVRELMSGRITKSGLEYIGTKMGLNPYCNNKRKYEILNETITDLFAIEARDRLHESGIYLLEDSQYTIENVQDANTGKILKKLVYPLVCNFKDELLEAIMGESISQLTDAVGMENFERLNDEINKAYAIESDEMDIENTGKTKEEAIKEIATRCKQIYEDMGTYKNNKEKGRGQCQIEDLEVEEIEIE